MKNAKSYKAFLYWHRSLATGFWEGSVIDKQMNDTDVNVSGYWITDFLDSDFRTTAEAGTRRLAVACRNAAKKAEVPSLGELFSANDAICTLEINAPGRIGIASGVTLAQPSFKSP